MQIEHLHFETFPKPSNMKTAHYAVIEAGMDQALISLEVDDMSSAGIESNSASAAGPIKSLPTDMHAVTRADDIVIGPGVRTVGKFQTAGSLFVDGALDDAEVGCRWMSVSSGGEFRGLVKAERVEIAGLLDGHATASEEIILRSTAVVRGKVTAPYVVVHRGAHLSGGVESTERQVDSRKPMSLPMPPTKSRYRRSLNLFVGTALVGLLLGGGAYAWWSGNVQAESMRSQTTRSST